MSRPATEVTLPGDLRKQVEHELASGLYQSRDELIEQALRHFPDERQRGQRRLDALRRIGQALSGRPVRASADSRPAMTGTPLVVLDAFVLANFSLCDTLLRLAEPPRLYEPKRSEEIIREDNPRAGLEARVAEFSDRVSRAELRATLAGRGSAVMRH